MIRHGHRIFSQAALKQYKFRAADTMDLSQRTFYGMGKIHISIQTVNSVLKCSCQYDAGRVFHRRRSAACYQVSYNSVPKWFNRSSFIALENAKDGIEIDKRTG